MLSHAGSFWEILQTYKMRQNLIGWGDLDSYVNKEGCASCCKRGKTKKRSMLSTLTNHNWEINIHNLDTQLGFPRLNHTWYELQNIFNKFQALRVWIIRVGHLDNRLTKRNTLRNTHTRTMSRVVLTVRTLRGSKKPVKILEQANIRMCVSVCLFAVRVRPRISRNPL